MALADLKDDDFIGTFCCNGCRDMRKYSRYTRTIYDPVNHHRFCADCDPRIDEDVRKRVYPDQKYFGASARVITEIEAGRIHLSHAASITTKQLVFTPAERERLTNEMDLLRDALRTLQAEIDRIPPDDLLTRPLPSAARRRKVRT